MIPERPDALAYLTGRLSGRDRPHPITEPGGGGKFTPQGAVLPFAGNTIVLHIPAASDAHAAMVGMQDALKSGPCAECFTWLPPASFHMTLFQGVSGPEPETGWPEGIAPGTALDQITPVLSSRLDGVTLPAARIRSRGLFAGHSLTVEGADAAQETLLRAARQHLRKTLRIDPPGFDSYVFHVSFAYLLRWLTDDQARDVITLSENIHARFADRLRDIALGPAEFCIFDNMYHFEPLRRIGKATV